MLQTDPVISRRHLLFAAAATTVAACSSKRDLTQPIVNPANATNSGDQANPVDASAVLTQPNPTEDKIPASVVMVGDSISALSQEALDAVITDMGFETVTINAESSRRIEIGRKNPTNGLDIVSFINGADPPEMWVIALGTNDAGLYATDEEYQGLIDEMLDVIDDDTPLVWVNTYRDDHLDGCVQFNNLLKATLAERGNATVADWYQQCVARASDILTDDGVHPNKNGILVFADLVRSAIATRLT